jgi:hypothetical protein
MTPPIFRLLHGLGALARMFLAVKHPAQSGQRGHRSTVWTRITRRSSFLTDCVVGAYADKSLPFQKQNMDDLQEGWNLEEKRPWDKICISSGCIVGSKRRSGQ